MILVGVVMAIAAGLALPGHMLMFGDIIDFFIAYDIAGDLQRNSNLTCDNLTTTITTETLAMALAPGNLSANSTMEEGEYFCTQEDTGGDSNIFRYAMSCDLGSLLQSDVAQYSYYYLGMAGGLLVAAFFAIALWNWAAYRQTRRMRTTFLRSILHQDIGWFDVNPSGELNTRLSE